MPIENSRSVTRVARSCLNLDRTATATKASRSRKIQHHHIGTLVDSFQDDFAAVWGEVEIANIEVGRKIRQLPFRGCVQVDEPEILVLDLSPQDQE
jgi:hypothetical protein